jgi:hypothetical protein
MYIYTNSKDKDNLIHVNREEAKSGPPIPAIRKKNVRYNKYFLKEILCSNVM